MHSTASLVSLSRWLPLFACIAFETAKCIGDRAPHVGMNIRPRAADRYEGIPLRQATKAFVRIRADRKLKLKSATEDREAFRPVAKVPAEPALEVQDCPPLAKSQDDAGQVSRRALVGIRKFSSLTVYGLVSRLLQSSGLLVRDVELWPASGKPALIRNRM